MKHLKKYLKCLIFFSMIMVGLGIGLTPARAELSEIKIANQYSLGHLPLMIMSEQKFLEKQLAQRNLDKVKISWVNLAGSSAMIDGLLSGSVHIASSGTTGFLILWDKTGGKIKAIGGETIIPTILVTRDPAVKRLQDLSEKNKIAVPAVGTSPQAIFLKIAAYQLFGKEKVDHFDKMTITMGHPDAYAAMLSGSGIIDSHFCAPPFDRWELEKIPGAHAILNSDDLLGGPTTSTVLMANEKFREENPQIFAAIVAALKESIDFINREPHKTAEIFLKIIGDKKTSVEETVKDIQAPGVYFTYVPKNTAKLANTMFEIGVLKRQVNDWKELFFSEMHDEKGS